MAVWLKNYHGLAAIFWALMVPVSFYTGLASQVRYVTFLSLWALVITEWGAWQASRAEVKVEQAQNVEIDHPDRVEIEGNQDA